MFLSITNQLTSPLDRDLFLNRLYAIRFMLRHQITLRSGGTMVGPHIFQQRYVLS